MAAVAGKVVTKNLEKIERCLFVGIPGEPLPPDPKHTPARWSEDLCICCTGTFFRSLFCPACALAEIQSYVIPDPRLTCCPDRPLPFLNSPWFLCGICLFGVLYEQHAVTKHILAGRLGLSDGCCKNSHPILLLWAVLDGPDSERGEKVQNAKLGTRDAVKDVRAGRAKKKKKKKKARKISSLVDIDDRETPLAAYEDIAPLLTLHSSSSSSSSSDVIYDPFFCRGTTALRLQSLGFRNVVHRQSDFYRDVEEDRLPAFDLFVTNPPFSGDHLERVFRFAMACGKPFCLLVPQYCARKRWFFSLPHRDELFFVAPRLSAYVFEKPMPAAAAPTGQKRRPEDREDREEADPAPVPAGVFQCVWFCRFPGLKREQRKVGPNAILCESEDAIPNLVLTRKPTPAERRWRKKLKKEEE
jgi:hypothetical protein